MNELNGNAALLRIFIGEADFIGHQPLYEALIYEAKKNGLAGGSAIRGIMSYGASSRLHTAKLLDISQDLPVVVEIIDTEEKIQEFSNVAGNMIDTAKCGGVITIEKINVVFFKPKS
jgi:PII-like signaling protein